MLLKASVILTGSLLLSASVACLAPSKADIRADTNRDGLVDIIGNSDLGNKAKWTESSGAIFLPNIGDTDRRCSKLALSGPPLSNEKLDDCNDASGNTQRAPHLMAPIRTVPLLKIAGNVFGTISVANKTARENVRIFRAEGDKWLYTDNEYKFSKKDLQAGLKLGIDARDTRRPGGWDGRVTVTFNVRSDTMSSIDEVMLRVAPVLAHHHLQKVEQVMALKGNDTNFPALVKFTKDVAKATKDAGIRRDVHLLEHTDDIWVQDFMEPGYASMPGPKGTVSIRINIRSPQDDRVAERLLFEYLRKAGVGAVQHLGGSRDEINSGGNIEALPPYSFKGKSWPAGRVVLGNWGQQKHHISAYLEAQEAQDPIHLDTAWLRIGHVDEFIQFIPADVPRGWVAVVSDPLAGIDILKSLKEQGHGSINAYSRKNNTSGKSPTCQAWTCDPIAVPATTVDQMLADKSLMDVNRFCAERIKSNIEILKREVGMVEDVFVHIPALFKRLQFNETETDVRVAALFPGSINNIVLTGYNTSIAPNPWGPSPKGLDILSESIKLQYAKVGWNIKLVDDWNTHHNFGGEVHCGSNTVRDMSTPWW